MFIITSALKEGSKLEGDIKSIRLIKRGRTYELDMRVRSGKAALFAIKINFHNIKKKTLNVENTKLMNNKRCYFLTLHQRLGHPSEDITRATGLKLGLKMKGTMRECKGCGLGKMRQKNVSKEQVPRAKNVGERMFVDNS